MITDDELRAGIRASIDRLAAFSGCARKDMIIVSHENARLADKLYFVGLEWCHDSACNPEVVHVIQKRDYDRTWRP